MGLIQIFLPPIKKEKKAVIKKARGNNLNVSPKIAFGHNKNLLQTSHWCLTDEFVFLVNECQVTQILCEKLGHGTTNLVVSSIEKWEILASLDKIYDYPLNFI